MTPDSVFYILIAIGVVLERISSRHKVRPKDFIQHSTFTFYSFIRLFPIASPRSIVSDYRDSLASTLDIGADKAAADFVPRRDCPRMISDPSSSGVKNSEEQPSWLLPRIYGTFRTRRFYEESAPETSRRSYNIEDGLL